MVLRINNDGNMIETDPDHDGGYTFNELWRQIRALRCPWCGGDGLRVHRERMHDLNGITYRPGPWECPRCQQPGQP